MPQPLNIPGLPIGAQVRETLLVLEVDQRTTGEAAIARTIARACAADGELVLAGVLLHDIGKLESYRWDGIFDHTESGSLLGHVTLGAMMLDRRIREEQPPPCTPQERDI